MNKALISIFVLLLASSIQPTRSLGHDQSALRDHDGHFGHYYGKSERPEAVKLDSKEADIQPSGDSSSGGRLNAKLGGDSYAGASEGLGMPSKLGATGSLAEPKKSGDSSGLEPIFVFIRRLFDPTTWSKAVDLTLRLQAEQVLSMFDGLFKKKTNQFGLGEKKNTTTM